nr:hypothetical protein [Rhizobium leguminosarum]
MTKSFAQECAKDQIFVNSVTPLALRRAKQNNSDSPTMSEPSAPAFRLSSALIARQTMPTPRRQSRPSREPKHGSGVRHERR